MPAYSSRSQGKNPPMKRSPWEDFRTALHALGPFAFTVGDGLQHVLHRCRGNPGRTPDNPCAPPPPSPSATHAVSQLRPTAPLPCTRDLCHNWLREEEEPGADHQAGLGMAHHLERHGGRGLDYHGRGGHGDDAQQAGHEDQRNCKGGAGRSMGARCGDGWEAATERLRSGACSRGHKSGLQKEYGASCAAPGGAGWAGQYPAAGATDHGDRNGALHSAARGGAPIRKRARDPGTVRMHRSGDQSIYGAWAGWDWGSGLRGESGEKGGLDRAAPCPST